jgi:hypothetical protein
MRIETTKDILKHFQKFHKLIADYYHDLSQKADKERVKLLLNYLEEREIQIEKTLNGLENSISSNVLNSWFTHSNCKEKLENLSNLLSGDLPSVNQVIDQFLYMDNCLIDLYSKLVESAENVEVQEFFDNLSELEKNHKKKILLNASQYEDI